MDPVRTSKFLSLILRHKPEAASVALDAEGWADVEALLAGMRRHGHPLGLEELVQVVATNNKRRFAFNADRTKIRAVQGHSPGRSTSVTPPWSRRSGCSTARSRAFSARSVGKDWFPGSASMSI